jgi:hypothetical protein
MVWSPFLESQGGDRKRQNHEAVIEVCKKNLLNNGAIIAFFRPISCRLEMIWLSAVARRWFYRADSARP